MRLATNTRGLIEANGTRLYHEITGNGPALLLIQGASGDADTFRGAAEQLSDDFTVITYDRRSNSRSPRPERWSSTSIAEQAADAAALVRVLDVGPLVAFGTSGGAAIGVELMLREPALLRGMVLHEPAIIAPLAAAAPKGGHDPIAAIVAPAMATGGPRAALEAFLRHFAGDANVDRMDQPMRARILANAETFFGVELEAFLRYNPAPADILASRVPLRIGIGTTSVPEARGGAMWLADLLGVAPIPFPGGHASYLDDPARFAGVVREAIRQLAG